MAIDDRPTPGERSNMNRIKKIQELDNHIAQFHRTEELTNSSEKIDKMLLASLVPKYAYQTPEQIHQALVDVLSTEFIISQFGRFQKALKQGVITL